MQGSAKRKEVLSRIRFC